MRRIESPRADRALSAALTAVTAAVAGVILSLAIHAVWTEVRWIEAGSLALELLPSGSIDWTAAGSSAVALPAVFRLKPGMATMLAGATVGGMALHAMGAAPGKTAGIADPPPGCRNAPRG